MAKRRRLTAPDADALKEIEAGFAAKPILETKSMAPIAQVAGEAAALASVADQSEREDAARLRAAQARGLIAIEVSIDDIDADYICRDRVEQNAEEMAELKYSIAKQGQRTPIEVVKTDDGYGLISGWRRLTALRELFDEHSADLFSTITAFVRKADEAEDVYLNMVEENEIRANLSHYERGRIASVAVGQGVYPDIDAAVNHLFGAASKSKRSKVRSFASIHEALGDLLTFPTSLTEKLGLKVGQALTVGQIKPLRAALANLHPESHVEEVRALERAISRINAPNKDPAKGGRPKAEKKLDTVLLGQGSKIEGYLTSTGGRIEIDNGGLSEKDLAKMMNKVGLFLQKN